MRHRKSFNHLGRKAPHRKAMLANMASSLIKHKRITTTTAKAKALRTYIEPLITRSKDDTTHSRRVVFSYLQDKDAVSELFREVAGKVAERPGGYTRIIKLGARLGDSAEMAVIELVDYNANLLEETSQKPKSRRRRRGGGSGKQGQQTETATADVQDAEVVEEKKNEPAGETGSEKNAETTENVTTDSEAETTEEKSESPAAEAESEEPGTEEEGQKKDEGETKGESDEEKKNS